MFDSKQGHGFEVDFWAIGVILFYMLFGRYPFESRSDDIQQIYTLIREEEPDYEGDSVSPEAKDLIR